MVTATRYVSTRDGWPSIAWGGLNEVPRGEGGRGVHFLRGGGGEEGGPQVVAYSASGFGCPATQGKGSRHPIPGYHYLRNDENEGVKKGKGKKRNRLALIYSISLPTGTRRAGWSRRARAHSPHSNVVCSTRIEDKAVEKSWVRGRAGAARC